MSISSTKRFDTRDVSQSPDLIGPWPLEVPVGASSHYKSGLRLFAQGESIHYLFSLVNGIARLERVDDPRGSAVLRFCAAPQTLGIVAALCGDRHVATATTVTDCEIKVIPVAEFHEKRLSDRKLIQWLQRTLAAEVEDKYLRLTLLGLRDAEERLARVIVELFFVGHERHPDGSLKLGFPVQVRQLAQCAIISADHASRLLRQFERSGLAQYNRNGSIHLPVGSRLAVLVGRTFGLSVRQKPAANPTEICS